MVVRSFDILLQGLLLAKLQPKKLSGNCINSCIKSSIRWVFRCTQTFCCLGSLLLQSKTFSLKLRPGQYCNCFYIFLKKFYQQVRSSKSPSMHSKSYFHSINILTKFYEICIDQMDDGLEHRMLVHLSKMKNEFIKCSTWCIVIIIKYLLFF